MPIQNTNSIGGASVRIFGKFFTFLGFSGIFLAGLLILLKDWTPIQIFTWFSVSLGCVLLGIFFQGFYIISEWIRVPVLLLGKYKNLKGPGVIWLFPWIYKIPFPLDIRIITTTFSAEQTLTRDNVPVNVDAVLFWQVIDAYEAAIKVQDYKTAILWAAQTALRDMIGKADLSQMLSGREKLAGDLEKIIDNRTEKWGVKSISVEIRDVIIPPELQDALSRQAQAERERQARIILAGSEEEIAKSFLNAAKTYERDEVALKLRSMNILYESMKEKGAWVVVPSDMVNLLGGNLKKINLDKTLN
ncbi:MAG: slipin family protein [Promethearchaeota archaeon]